VTAEYFLEYRSPTGTRTFLEMETLEYSRAENTPGALIASIKPVYDVGYFEQDAQLYAYRSVNGLTPYVDGETFWFLDRARYDTDDQGKNSIILEAHDSLSLLSRRIVANFGGTSYTSKLDYADDLLKDIMREQFGVSALDVTRDLSAKISVQADVSLGQIVGLDIQWENVQDIFNTITENSDELGTKLIYDLVRTGYDSLEFRTWTEYRGVDRSRGSASPLVVSQTNGLLGESGLEFDYTEEVNSVYVGGRGYEEAREVINLEDATRSGASAYNLREAFENASNSTDTTKITNAGYAVLSAGRPKVRFTGRILQNRDVIYGLSYNYGDRVTANYLGYEIDCRIAAFGVQYSQENGENLDIYLSAENFL